MAKTKTFEIIINEEKCTGCRICQLICSYLYQGIYAPAKAHVQISDVYEMKPKIKFLETCTQCGQCAQHCLYGALKIKEDDS